MNSLNWRNIFISGVIFAVLALILVAGIYLVKRPQSQSVNSKAALTCGMRWYADPNSACGQATQQPHEGASDVSLTPNFHWDYGGYRLEDNGQCVQPSGCSNYSAIVYLAEGASYSANSIIGRCGLGTTSTPPKDAPFSCFNISALKPNTTYSWVVTPFGDGIVHAEQTWTSHFKTAAAPTNPVCNSLALTPSNPVITLTSLARQLTASATGGTGNLAYTYTVTNTGGAGNGNLSQSSSGAATATWTAPDLSAVATNQSWIISATANGSPVGGCTVTLTYSPVIAGAACQMVQADKDLSKINLGDTVNFTGYGSLGADQGDSIDKIEFTLVKDNAAISTDSVDTTRATEKDSGNLKFWKATKTYTISQPGSYSTKIRVHWKNGNVWKA